MPKVIFEFSVKSTSTVPGSIPDSEIINYSVDVDIQMRDSNDSANVGPDDVYAHVLMSCAGEVMELIRRKYKYKAESHGATMLNSTITPTQVNDDNIH